MATIEGTMSESERVSGRNRRNIKENKAQHGQRMKCVSYAFYVVFRADDIFGRDTKTSRKEIDRIHEQRKELRTEIDGVAKEKRERRRYLNAGTLRRSQIELR